MVIRNRIVVLRHFSSDRGGGEYRLTNLKISLYENNSTFLLCFVLPRTRTISSIKKMWETDSTLKVAFKMILLKCDHTIW